MTPRLALLATLLVAAPAARAVDIHVDASNGSDTNDGLTWATAMASVDAALALAQTLPGPDAVVVAEGRYVGQIVMPPETSLIGGYATGGAEYGILDHPTILDGAGAGPVVYFGPGTSECLLDGFIITGGVTTDRDQGGGITMTGTSATVSACIVQHNRACRGGGFHVEPGDTVAGPHLIDCVALYNTADCGDGSGQGAAVWAGRDRAHQLVPGYIVVDGLIAAWNIAPVGRPGALTSGGTIGASHAEGALTLANIILMENDAAGIASGFDEQESGPAEPYGSAWCSGCALVDNRGGGVEHHCGASAYSVLLWHLSIVGNRGGLIFQRDPAFLSVGDTNWIVGTSVVEPGQTIQNFLPECFGGMSSTSARHSVIASADVPAGRCWECIDAAPIFASGPLGNVYLAQTAAGQPVTSPGVDADANPPTGGLETRTTRTDGVPDTGLADWGYHYPTSHPIYSLRDFRIRRGAAPQGLPVHVPVVPALPWLDAPGTHSDPSLPLLFYSVEWPFNRILVSKDPATDAVRISF